MVVLASDRPTEFRPLSLRMTLAHGYASLNLAIDLVAHVQEQQGTLQEFLRRQRRVPAYDCRGVVNTEKCWEQKDSPPCAILHLESTSEYVSMSEVRQLKENVLGRSDAIFFSNVVQIPGDGDTTMSSAH